MILADCRVTGRGGEYVLAADLVEWLKANRHRSLDEAIELMRVYFQTGLSPEIEAAGATPIPVPRRDD